ncbi:MAG: hypothetical protein WBB66_00210 [Candidatus Omnitrophota bacterium]
MRKFFVLFIIACFLLSGCGTTKFGLENVKVYHVEEERVDQAVKGNQGYITGEAPPAVGPRKTTRTLIKVDVEVPGDFYPLSTVIGIGKDLPGGEGEVPEEPEEAEEAEEAEDEWLK